MSEASGFDEAAARVAAGADPNHEAAALVAAMTDDERRWCLDGDQPFWAGLTDLGQGGYHRRPFPAARVERLGIPGFAFVDGPRGVVVGPATCFPVSMARGAAWDVGLEERIGDAIGQEVRAVGATLYGGVCVNVLRHPAWGRAQETYGEDPHHVGELGAALTRGVQRHAMACVKHFACNSMENGRFVVDVTVDEAALHDVYLPHFRRIVDEGVAVVMSAYNAVDGEWCGQHRGLLTDVLRDEWGFEGMVISDWIFGLRDAGRSVRAGLDVEMPYRMVRAHGLDDDLAAGEVTPDEIASAATRVVATLLRWNEVLSTPAPGRDVLSAPDHRDLAREAATKSIVLLRNEPVPGDGDGGGGAGKGRPLLPLRAGDLHRVAVLGRLAAVRNLGDGGSSDVWAPTAVTPLDGLRAALPEATAVLHDDGDDPAAAAELAASVDVAVVVVGYTKADEGEFIGAGGTDHLLDLMPGADDPDLAAAFTAAVEAEGVPAMPPGMSPGERIGFSDGGDRSSLRLHPDDEALVLAVAAANPRTVVAIVAGSAVLVDAWDQAVPAIVQSWYAGMEGGHALADVLLGAAEPTGRLPFTVPADPAHLPPFDRDAHEATYDAWHGYWLLARDGHRAAYPFGFGLSYTDLSIGPSHAVVDGSSIVVSTSARNGGERAGAEVIQVYAGPEGGSLRLVGFARVEVGPGQEHPGVLRIPIDRLARRDVDLHRSVVAPGRYEVRVARHAADPEAHVLAVDLD
jgi:beta-glucosidase